MLKNYYEIDEDENISLFLKNLDDKKNVHYIILNDDKLSFVDIRSIALRMHNFEEKLKSLKKPISYCDNSCSDEEKFKILLNSGDRVIKLNEGFYDFIDALKYILNKNFSFLKQKLSFTFKDEVYVLNYGDKMSQARNLFIKNRINLLPVIDQNKNVIGELRPIDFLIGKLHLVDSNNKNYYDKNKSSSILNLPIENIINKRPIIFDINLTYKDAIEKMVSKNLPSFIVVDKNKLFTIITYKDIFKLVNNFNVDKNYNINYNGTQEIYDDDLDLIKELVEKTMEKIYIISGYDLLKVSFKTHGNLGGSHKKKFEVNLILSKGNKVIHVNKETLGGFDDEYGGNKIKIRWNTPLLVQNALKVLIQKVITEKNKK